MFTISEKTGNEGLFGVAHPNFINPDISIFKPEFIEKCQKENKDIRKEVVSNLFKELKEKGGDLFCASEINYQSYGARSNADFESFLANLADSNALLKAGGVDAHQNSLFMKHEPMTIQKAKDLGLYFLY